MIQEYRRPLPADVGRGARFSASTLTWSLVTLADVLGRLGENVEALRAVEEAVELNRQWTADGEVAVAPELAWSLVKQAETL